jgi:hypothetical protein
MTPISTAKSATTRRRALQRMFVLLAVVTAALTGGAYAWDGIDTAGAALLGCAIVAFNLLGTAHFVSAVLAERRFKGRLVASLTVKLGLTLVVLYIAVNRWGMSPVGIVIGLSSMLIVSLLFAALRPAESAEGEAAEDEPGADGPH